jgi:DNA-binding SARP family transcriptional activator
MFYSLSETGDVTYDLKRFNNDENAREALSQERALIEGEGNAFDQMFGFGEGNDEDEAGL